MLKDTKDIPISQLIITIFNSRMSGRHPAPEWIFSTVIVISALNLLALGLNIVFYICRRSAKVSYRLARNRGKTTEAPALYKAVPVYTGEKDDVLTEEEISIQSVELDQTNALILTGIKQKQSQSKQTKTAFPVLKLAGSTASYA